MLLILLITVDFARVFFTYIQVNNAAREGAAYGAASPTDTATITARALQEVDAQAQRGENTPVVTASCADALGNSLACSSAPGGSGTGNTITVGVAERFDFITPLINGVFGNSFQVNGSATAAVINLAASGSGGGPGTCTIAPNASFTFSVSGLGVTLDGSGSTPDSGLCAISGYNWSMGDPANPDPFPPITGVAASYAYPMAGTYTITLEVTNQAGNSTTTRTVTVGAGPTPTPTPAATPTPTPAPTPTPTPVVCTMAAGISTTFLSGYAITFTGSYTGQPVPVTWSWTFAGGSPATSGVQAPGTVQYPDTGNNGTQYTVTLTITNGPCTSTKTISVKPKKN